MICPSINLNQKHPFSAIPYTQKIESTLRDYLKGLTQPKTMLKLLGIDFPNEQRIATTLVTSKLVTIPEIIDFETIQHDNALNLLAYIDQPNEEVENKVYSIYGEILDLFPKTEIDLRIIELYGRTKKAIPQVRF